MPPKKGKGKGKGKGKKKSSAKKKKSEKKAAAEDGSLSKPVTEETRQYYLHQLQQLDERVLRYQEKNDVLEVRNKDLEQRLHTEQRDKFDITITLKRQLGETVDLNAELQEKISQQFAKYAEEKDAFEQQINSLKTQIKEQRDQFKAEIEILQGSLKSLEDFKRMKDEIEARTNRLTVALQDVSDEYKRYRAGTEKSMVIKQERYVKVQGGFGVDQQILQCLWFILTYYQEVATNVVMPCKRGPWVADHITLVCFRSHTAHQL
eukprot:scpid72117/ scgid4591/ Uncharacterized protein C9orf117